jgi:hypothetical protein
MKLHAARKTDGPNTEMAVKLREIEDEHGGPKLKMNRETEMAAR